MDKIFVVKNQHGLYLSKQQEWLTGADAALLFRTPHRDEAINTVFEVSSKDIAVRAEAVACEPDAKNNPVVEVADQPELPIAATAEEADATEGEQSHGATLADTAEPH